MSSRTENEAPVTVSISKLVAGVGTMFAGVVQMLEALEPHVAQQIVDIAVQNRAQRTETQETAVTGGESDDAADAIGGASVPDVPADDVPTPVSDAVTEAPTELDTPATAEKVEQKQEAAQETASTVTEDDLTKIIVRKIKQNRSNNEKIGAILKTYGVAKVSELPVSKYEAFLTDVSQL